MTAGLAWRTDPAPARSCRSATQSRSSWPSAGPASAAAPSINGSRSPRYAGWCQFRPQSRLPRATSTAVAAPRRRRQRRRDPPGPQLVDNLVDVTDDRLEQSVRRDPTTTGWMTVAAATSRRGRATSRSLSRASSPGGGAETLGFWSATPGCRRASASARRFPSAGVSVNCHRGTIRRPAPQMRTRRLLGVRTRASQPLQRQMVLHGDRGGREPAPTPGPMPPRLRRSDRWRRAGRR